MEIFDGRRSCDTDLGSTAGDTISSAERIPQNLEGQFLRQSSQSLPFDQNSVRETGSVDSFTSGTGLRAPSNASINSRGESRQRTKKKAVSNMVYTPVTLNYHGINIYQAASQGSLPICVLLWGMASSKRINLMTPDFQGNNPIHYAALADNPEVLGFLIQQTRGYLTEDVRLVDSRNRMGETALLRAMNTGVNSVIKALIDEKSDPLVIDAAGNNVFTVLAKRGHLWTLNYVYQIICNTHGAHVAQELMATPDNDGHTPLEWAADSGDVNVTEFFMRKGMSPFRRDPMNRTALFWAVKSGRVNVARYLMKCGSNAELIDTTGQSPLKIAQGSGNRDMIAALSLKSLPKETHIIRTAYKDAIHDSTHSADASLSPPLFATINGRKVSHAIERKNRSNPRHALLFGLIVFVFWISTLIVPFYVWVLLVFGALWYHRYIDQLRHRQAALAAENPCPEPPQPLTRCARLKQFILCAREKGLGLWLGSALMYFLFLLSATINHYRTMGHSDVNNINNDYTKGIGGFHTVSPLDLGGQSFVYHDRVLYYIVCGLFMASVIAWTKLVWFCPDPGIIDTRDANFEEIMAQSFAIAGSPPPTLFCRTTLVKKPIRSKFCKHAGCVIARMDHYCAWLNTTIGYKNHRTFIVFLQLHLYLCLGSVLMLIRALHREVPLTSTCDVLGVLLNGEYFYVTALLCFLVVVSILLAMLIFEQFVNIARNMTTNERLNHTRYYWLLDNDGTLCNKFDRGVIGNVLEFWGVPGFRLDYTKCFELPTPYTRRSKYTLTQENIMRYSNSSQVQLLPVNPTGHGHGHGGSAGYLSPDKADPTYGGDLEMQQHSTPSCPPTRSDRTSLNTFTRQHTSSSRAGPSSMEYDMAKMRADSLDSSDTTGSNIF